MATDKAIEVVKAIEALTAERGWAPSYRELMDRLGLRSTSTMQHRIKSAEYQGLIEVGGKSQPRSLRVTKEGKQWL